MQGHTLDPNSPLPRYYQIYSALLARIESGELKNGEVLPAERQLADSFGVARPTVVKALELLRREGRLEKQQGHGNIVLTPTTDSPKNKTIAFVAAPPITHALVTAMSQTAFEYGYHLRILGVDDDYGGLETYLNACVNSGVAGFLIYGRCEPGDAQLYKNLLDSGVPVVMVDRYVPGLACDHVVYDNEAASYELTLKLLVRGRRTIAVLPGQELTTTAVQDRLRGHRRALADAGISYDEDLVWLDLYERYLPQQNGLPASQGTSYQRLRERLETHQPSAVFTINDIIATYLVHDLLHLRGTLSRSADEARHDLELATFSAAPNRLSLSNRCCRSPRRPARASRHRVAARSARQNTSRSAPTRAPTPGYTHDHCRAQGAAGRLITKGA